MPLYEYECEACGKRVERLSKVNQPAPSCCMEDMKKLISRTSFSLKGDGWAKDGYETRKV